MVTSLADQRARWQAKLDAMLPSGAVATWVRPGRNRDATRYQVIWVYVESMAGLDPVLTLYVWGGRVLSGLRLTSLDLIRTKPHLIVRATFLNESPMQLCAEVPAPLAAQMAEQRTAIQESVRGEAAA